MNHMSTNLNSNVALKVECVLNEYYTKPEVWGKTGLQVEFLSHEDPFHAPSDKRDDDKLCQLAMNDCLYRARAMGYEFVLNGDLDEMCHPNFTKYNVDSSDGGFVQFARTISRHNITAASWSLGLKFHYMDLPDGGSKEIQERLNTGMLHMVPQPNVDQCTNVPIQFWNPSATIMQSNGYSL